MASFTVGTLLIRLLEFEGVERGLVVITSPDMVHAALALEQKLVDIGSRLSSWIIGAHIAFLVSAHAHAAAAWASNVSGRERDVHKRAVGAIVVVAPDQPFLVCEHCPSARSAILRLRDPLG